MKIFSLLLAAALTLSAQGNTLTPKEISDGWLLLFDGETSWGWAAEGGVKPKVVDGALTAAGSDPGWLHTTTQFSDYILKADFESAAALPSSSLLLRAHRPMSPAEAGYHFELAAAPNRPPLQAGRWHSLEIVVLGPRILIKINGKKTVDFMGARPMAGYIGLQFVKDKPIRFRNIRLQPVGLGPIFNGKNLSGWQVVQPPKPAAEPAEWSARKGAVHVVKGPGQLESKAQFDDFVLQMDVKTSTNDANFHPNSGIFFRGRPGVFWTGYEIQIRNEYKDNDRAKPVDTGSGGIYFHQPARRVIPSDNQFYTQTVIAQGRHIATWVNGYPVADWEDPHPEGDGGPRNRQALLKAGPISLQAHDPKTNLDFRNIRVKSLSRQP